MGAAVQDVEHRDREHVRVGTAHGAVEGNLQIVGHGLGAGQRDGQDGVGPEPPLVGCPVQVDQCKVDRPLVERIQPADRTGDLAVDVGHGALDTLAPEPAASVAQFDRLADARRCTGRGDGTPTRAGVEQDLGLHGGVATGIEDLAPDDVLNGAHEFSPSAPSLVGHPAVQTSGSSCPVWGRPRRRRCRHAGATLARAARVRRRSRGVGRGSPPRRGTRPRRARDQPRQRTAGRRDAGRPSPRPPPTGPGPRRRGRSSAPGGSKPTERALRANFAVSISDGSPAGCLRSRCAGPSRCA